ncbi:MAG: ROK family protein [Oscillospiraceae bacterium]|nr:ROK family protein [Oscillospiraceae bacterium]
MYYIGIDLGGTNVAAGVTDKEGRLLGKASIPCPRGVEAIADAMAESARLAAQEANIPLEECASVGVASPGSIDPAKGIVFHAFNLGLDHVPLAQMVSDRLGGIPTLLENDANAAALGEYVAGAGKGKNSLVAITLGTGVGSGAVLEGKLYTGFNYAAFESGHMVIHRGGRPCTCGRKGCWEAYASATGLIKSAREAMEAHPESALWKFAPTLEEVTGKTPFDAAQAGDAVAQAVLDEYIEDLVCGLANMINILQPEVLCIGGGICKQGENLMKPLRAVLDREEFTKDAAHRTQVCIAKLGNDAGIIGGAMLPLYR